MYFLFRDIFSEKKKDNETDSTCALLTPELFVLHVKGAQSDQQFVIQPLFLCYGLISDPLASKTKRDVLLKVLIKSVLSRMLLLPLCKETPEACCLQRAEHK